MPASKHFSTGAYNESLPWNIVPWPAHANCLLVGKPIVSHRHQPAILSPFVTFARCKKNCTRLILRNSPLPTEGVVICLEPHSQEGYLLRRRSWVISAGKKNEQISICHLQKIVVILKIIICRLFHGHAGCRWSLTNWLFVYPCFEPFKN